MMVKYSFRNEINCRHVTSIVCVKELKGDRVKKWREEERK